MAPKKTKKEKKAFAASDNKETAQKKTFFKTSPHTDSHATGKSIQGKSSLLWVTALSLATMLPLLFRGSYFPQEQHLAQMVIMMLFLGWMFQDTLQGNRITIVAQPWPLILGFFVVAYTLPVIIFQWANLDMAIGMILWYVSLLLLYWLVRKKIYEKNQTGLFLDLWIIAGLILAAIGLVSLSGYGNLTDAVMGNRVASTFQYPNTLAAFLMALFFIACGRLLEAETLKKKVLYAGAGWWMVLVFILTYSRAAWLIFPLAAVAYWLLIPRREKLPLLFYYTITAVVLLLILQPVTRLVPAAGQTEPRLIIFALGGLLATVVLVGFMLKAVNALRDRHEKAAYGAFALIALLGIGFMILAFTLTGPLTFENPGEAPRTQTVRRTVEGVYPGEYQLGLQVEAQGGSEDQWPWQVRIDAVKETGDEEQVFQHTAAADESGIMTFAFENPEDTTGLVIFFQHRFPETSVTFSQAEITALDGEWQHTVPLAYTFIPEALAARFQTIEMGQYSVYNRLALYRDSLTMFRDRPLTGAGGGSWEQLYRQYQSEPYTSRNPHTFFLQVLVESGVVGLLSVILLMGVLLLGAYQAFRKKKLLGISLYTALLAALAHSALDFNMLFFSFSLFIWSLIALLPSMEDAPVWQPLHKKANRLQLPALVLLLLTMPILLVTGLRYSAMNEGAAASAAAAEGDVESAYLFLDSAIGRNPFNPLYRSDMVQLLIAVSQQGGQTELLDLAAGHLDSGLRYAPNHDSLMRQGISLYGSLGDTGKVLELADQRASRMPLYTNTYVSNVQALNQYARLLLSADKQEEAVQVIDWNMSHVPRLLEANETANRPARITAGFREAMNEAQAIQQALQDGVSSETIQNGFTFASFPDLEFQLGTERMWRISSAAGAEVTSTLTVEGLLVENQGNDSGFVYTPNLPLEPATTYQVQIHFSEISLAEPLSISLIATDSKDHRTQYSHVHHPSADGLSTSFAFQTTGEIDPANNQYLRFDHPGGSTNASAGTFTIKGVYLYPAASSGTVDE